MKNLTKINKILLVLLFNIITIYNAKSGIIIDTVISFTAGTGQNIGQSSEYYPMNIFKLPPATASQDIPASSPDDVCSLGLGGEIIVGFKDNKIIDGSGPDFTIFENPFINPANKKIFAEPAKVAVSLDGITWYEFPFDSLTLKGCAGVNPVNGGTDYFNPQVSGGDTFDLATLNLKEIKYIKITDISSMILNNKDHPFYDVDITGFDLDCAVGINFESDNTGIKDLQNNSNIYTYTFNHNLLSIKTNCNFYENRCNIYNLYGELIYSNKFYNYITIDMSKESSGMYFFTLEINNKIYFEKIILK